MSDLKFTIEPSGALKITADPEFRDDLRSLENGCERYAAFTESLPEGWEELQPEKIGALTEAPILSNDDNIFRDDEGEINDVKKVWWFPDYMIIDFTERLMAGEAVFFQQQED